MNKNGQEKETESELDADLLESYLEQFYRYTKEDNRYYRGYNNLMAFGYWFLKIDDDYQEAILEKTITDDINCWYKVLYHGTLVGKNALRISRFLKNQGVLEQIKNYSVIKRKEEELKKKERLEKEKTRVRKKQEFAWYEAKKKHVSVRKRKLQKQIVHEQKLLWGINHKKQARVLKHIRDKGKAPINRMLIDLNLDLSLLNSYINDLVIRGKIYSEEAGVWKAY